MPLQFYLTLSVSSKPSFQVSCFKYNLYYSIVYLHYQYILSLIFSKWTSITENTEMTSESISLMLGLNVMILSFYSACKSSCFYAIRDSTAGLESSSDTKDLRYLKAVTVLNCCPLIPILSWMPSLVCCHEMGVLSSELHPKRLVARLYYVPEFLSLCSLPRRPTVSSANHWYRIRSKKMLKRVGIEDNHAQFLQQF